MKLKTIQCATRHALCMIFALSALFSCTTNDVDAPDNSFDEYAEHSVSLSFTNADSLGAYGIGVPANGQGTVLVDPIVKGPLTMTCVNAPGTTGIRAYATSGNGVLDLRIYKGDAIVFSVSEGYKITALSWSSANASTIDAYVVSVGSIANGVWSAPSEGCVNSITMEATGTTRMNDIKVKYAKLKPGEVPLIPGTPENPPMPEEPDPLAADSLDHVVMLDFTNADSLKSYGFEVPANGGRSLMKAPIVRDSLTFSAANLLGAADDKCVCAYATSGDGVLDLRIYACDTLTYRVSDGYVIKDLRWTAAKASALELYEEPSVGTISGGVWKAPESGEPVKEIKLVANGVARINKVTVTFARPKK